MKLYDVIIIGSGAAGVFCSLNLPEDSKVLLVTQGLLEESNSYLAQGGITTVLDSSDLEPFVEDTLKAGGYANDEERVRGLGRDSFNIVKLLIDRGIPFSKNCGQLDYTCEGGHQVSRIIHGADQTGKVVMDVLIRDLKKQQNVEIWENSRLLDLLENQCESYRYCSGIVVQRDREIFKVAGKKIVLATGGIGGLFKQTTNLPQIKGIGLALGKNHNIHLSDLDKIQFHPTVSTFVLKGQKQKFLLSEALRGEGALLIDERGERFVEECLPRDLVTAAITKKESEGHTVYLMAKPLSRDFIIERFPYLYECCLEGGYDLGVDRIPISPAQHYHMGGITVDEEGRSSLANLYAIGEVSCTGIHGNNRLASNSLLEAFVYGYRAAKSISKDLQYNKMEEPLNKEDKDAIHRMQKIKGTDILKGVGINGDLLL